MRRGEPGFAGIQHDPDKMMGVIVEFVTMMQRRQQPEGWPELSEHRCADGHVERCDDMSDVMTTQVVNTR